MMEKSGGNDDEDGAGFKKWEDRLLPINNIDQIMKKALPPNTRVSMAAKQMMQECVSEFLSFVTNEAANKCKQDRRMTMKGDDVCSAMNTLGFDNFADAVWRYLQRYRELKEGISRKWEEEDMARKLEEDKASQERNNMDGLDLSL